MKKSSIENWVTTLRSLFAYLKKEQEKLSVLPLFLVLLSALEESIKLLEGLLEAYSLNTKGITLDKAVLRQDLSVLSLEFSTKLIAFAKFNENNTLLEEIRFTKSDFKRFSDPGLVSTADNLLKRSKEYQDQLRPYGLTDEALVNFEGKINLLRETRTDPRLAKSNKSRIKSQIEEEIKKSKVTLSKISALLSIIQTTLPDIFKGYLSARRVANTGRTKISFRGKISDIFTGLPLAGAKITLTVVGNGGKAAYELRSAPKGHFRLKSIPAGDYVLLASKFGYATKTIRITIDEKEPTVVEVEMEKEVVQK